MDAKELEDRIKNLEDRMKTHECKRLLQQDIMPGIIKARHLDAYDTGLTITPADSNQPRSFLFDGYMTVNSALFVDGYLLANDDLVFFKSSDGVVLNDRTTGTYYRLKVDNGVFGLEVFTG
jgi:hypothetical protein